MPPKVAPDEPGRGRGRGRGGRGSIDIDRGGVRGRSRGRGRGHGRGGRPSTRGPPPSDGPSPRGAPSPARATTVRQKFITAAHVQATGVKRPGHGTAGRVVDVFTNHFATELQQGTIYHYDVILPEKPLPTARNFQIIDALQTQVEPELFERPGAYDGRKNLFVSFELPFENGSREFVVPMGPPPSPGEATRGGRGPLEYRVRLTHVASINPEVLQRFLRGEQSSDIRKIAIYFFGLE